MRRQRKTFLVEEGVKRTISIPFLFGGARALCVAIFAPGLANGAAIPVNNASFEDNVLGGNAWADASPNGWFSEGNVAGTPGAPTTDPNFNNTFLELSSAIGASGGDGPNNLGLRTNAYIYQDLGVLFQPNTTYTVDIMVNRRGGANNVGYFGIADNTGTLLGTPGATNSSQIGTSNQFFAVSTLDPAAGNVATYITGATVPAGNVILAIGATTGNVVYDLISVDATSNIPDPNGDDDNDGLRNAWDLGYGLDPNSDVGDDGADGDQDGDNLTNIEEQTAGTNPTLDDSDNDGISDGAETGDGNFVDANQTGSDPNKFDTDADGYSDEKELAAGTNPNDPNDKPAFPVPLGDWSFDDQEAATTADLSPNGYDGTVLGEASYVADHTGAAGDFAIDLDGIDDAVTTPLTLGNIGFFTMAGWIKSDVAQTNRTGLFGQNDILEFGFSAGDTVQLW